MDLLDFISDPGRKAALAERTGSSPAYLWQIATGWTPKGGRPKRASVELAIAIEEHSRAIGPEEVPRSSLRADVWPPVVRESNHAANDDSAAAAEVGHG